MAEGTGFVVEAVRPNSLRLAPVLRALGRDPAIHASSAGGLAWLLSEAGEAVGCALVHPVPGLPGLYELQGGILPGRRRQGLGRYLLKSLLADLARSPVRRLTAVVSSTGSPAARFLLAQGFFVEHHEWLLVRADLSALPEPALPPGFGWRTYERETTVPLFRRLYEASFSGLAWHQPYADDGEVAAELAEAGDLLYLNHGPEPVGFAWLRPPENGEAQIEPLGLVPAYQGRGLGRTLLIGALRRLSERGVRRALVGLWADNERALGLYRKLGFRRRHRRTFLALDLDG
jgi:mycothiol synthase